MVRILKLKSKVGTLKIDGNTNTEVQNATSTCQQKAVEVVYSQNNVSVDQNTSSLSSVSITNFSAFSCRKRLRESFVLPNKKLKMSDEP